MSSKFEGKNYYEILGVTNNASKEAIKKAYKNIALIYHPDSNFFNEILGSRQKSEDSLKDFQIITNAFNVLTDDQQRKEYDSTLVSFRDWSEEETVDDYFQDMLKKKAIDFSIRNSSREREATLCSTEDGSNYFRELAEKRKSKFEKAKEEYFKKLENGPFSQIVKVRFFSKIDLLLVLGIGLLVATIILYLLAF